MRFATPHHTMGLSDCISCCWQALQPHFQRNVGNPILSPGLLQSHQCCTSCPALLACCRGHLHGSHMDLLCQAALSCMRIPPQLLVHMTLCRAKHLFPYSCSLQPGPCCPLQTRELPLQPSLHLVPLQLLAALLPLQIKHSAGKKRKEQTLQETGVWKQCFGSTDLLMSSTRLGDIAPARRRWYFVALAQGPMLPSLLTGHFCLSRWLCIKMRSGSY